jgi:hypothetical protein
MIFLREGNIGYAIYKAIKHARVYITHNSPVPQKSKKKSNKERAGTEVKEQANNTICEFYKKHVLFYLSSS